METDILKVKILSQPNDTTCGPTSLHALYSYYGDDISLKQVISEVHSLTDGGTLAVWLACHALERGYDATIYTYNLTLFDPTWFKRGRINIARKLEQQEKAKNDPKISDRTKAYLQFLELGGKLRLKELTSGLIRGYLKKQTPILTGLSSTYLYSCSREYAVGETSYYDDIKGYPQGHFVLVSGMDNDTKYVHIADPYVKNPLTESKYYKVKLRKLLHSIMLGVITHDANLLVIQPQAKPT